MQGYNEAMMLSDAKDVNNAQPSSAGFHPPNLRQENEKL